MADGFSERALFKDFDFGAAQLCDDRYRLTVDQHERFLLRVFELTGNPHYSLHLIESDSSSFETIISLAALSCDDLLQALRLVVRYLKIVTRVFAVTLDETGDTVTYKISSYIKNDRVNYFAISSFALLTDKLLYNATRNLHTIDKVEVQFSEPAGFASVKQQFPFTWRFNRARNCIVFKKQYLDREIRKTDLISARLILEMAEKQLQEVEAEATGGKENSLLLALRALLEREIKSPPRLDEAARILGQSSRSLRRKLAEAGTTFQTELDAVRHKTAKELLEERRLSIAEIAFELGYNNVSDFGRAFKRWNGSSPRAYLSTLASV